MSISGRSSRSTARSCSAALGDLLETSVAIFESAAPSGSLVVMTGLLSSAGDPVVIAIQGEDSRTYDTVNPRRYIAVRRYLTADFVNSA